MTNIDVSINSAYNHYILIKIGEKYEKNFMIIMKAVSNELIYYDNFNK